MKKLYTILAAALVTAATFAQTPEKMSYQALVRNSSDLLISNQAVGMQISILQTTATGTAVYVETQVPTTNVNGLVTLEIGTGSVVSGDFTTIDWSIGSYFIKTETDPAGGTTYTITGTSQLMSVPYALYAKTSGSATPGPQGAQGIQGATGTSGADGAPGAPGANGTQGPQGSTGSAGADGLPGLDGAQGPVGPTGLAGADGLPGNDGATGATGAQGPAGADGTNGTQGPQGTTGSAGADGLPGNDGATGAQGPAGADGLPGLDGAQGTQGPVGSVGPTGPAGSLGPQGITGADGVGIAQTLSFTSPNLVLSDNGGSIDLTGLINDADSDNSNEIQNLSQVLTEGNTAGAQLKNVTDPTDAQDAATKSYVDALEARIATLETPATYTVNTFYAELGGYVIEINTDGTHGLVAAMQDQGTLNLYAATGLLSNAANHDADGAKFKNWRLPTKRELDLMYVQKASIGGFANDFYWSSSETDSLRVLVKYFINGGQVDRNKTDIYVVRAVRVF